TILHYTPLFRSVPRRIDRVGEQVDLLLDGAADILGHQHDLFGHASGLIRFGGTSPHGVHAGHTVRWRENHALPQSGIARCRRASRTPAPALDRGKFGTCDVVTDRGDHGEELGCRGGVARPVMQRRVRLVLHGAGIVGALVAIVPQGVYDVAHP